LDVEVEVVVVVVVEELINFRPQRVLVSYQVASAVVVALYEVLPVAAQTCYGGAAEVDEDVTVGAVDERMLEDDYYGVDERLDFERYAALRG
jgi:hypothetical protein